MVCLFSFTCTFFNRSFRTLIPRFLLCSFFRSSIKKIFEKMGLSQFWLANIVCVRIIASIYMHLLERPICSKVVEGASIMRYIFLKLHKVLLSLLTPRYLLLAHLFVLRCMLPDTRCSVLLSRSLRADWIFN